MCVGKALTGGYLSMAATLCTDQVARGISEGEAGALMHGPTYMANPLAAAVAAASIELLRARDWRGEVSAIERTLAEGLAGARGLPGVADVRVLGAIGVIQTARPVDVPAVQKIVMAHGVWLRPFRDLIYTMPPYACTPGEVARITEAMLAAARAQ
jgi:adenosylmethionine-8-amino-7-oxononanoate aminotransferase